MDCFSVFIQMQCRLFKEKKLKTKVMDRDKLN